MASISPDEFQARIDRAVIERRKLRAATVALQKVRKQFLASRAIGDGGSDSQTNEATVRTGEIR